MKIMNLFRQKKELSEDRNSRDVSLDCIHEKKVLNGVKIVMMKDIVSSMDIVSSYNGLIKARYDSDGGIFLTTKVDGVEGWYHIYNVSIELIEVSHNIIPKLRIQNTYLNDLVYEFLLVEITIPMLVSLSKYRNGSSAFETMVLDRTQSERLDILDVISEAMERLQTEYKFRGYSRMTRGKELL